MREVIYKPTKKDRSYTEGSCPSCGGRLYRDIIPCPDSKEGCIVAHYGYICEECGKIYQ